MHTSGKVAAWLVAIALLVGAYFTVRTFRIRDAWMKVAQDNEKKIKENDGEIAKLTKTLEDKRMLLARTMIGWDRLIKNCWRRKQPSSRIKSRWRGRERSPGKATS